MTFTTNRPVEEVFAYLSVVEHGPRYIAGQREAHITSTGPMGKGTTFAVPGGFLHRSSTCKVIDYEPDRQARLGHDIRRAGNHELGLPAGGSRHPSRIHVHAARPGGYGRLRLPEWLQRERASERVDRELWTLKELLAPSNREAKAWSYQARTPAERGTTLVPVAVGPRASKEQSSSPIPRTRWRRRQ